MGNAEIRDLYNRVIGLFNESTLPIEVKRLIAENVNYLIEKTADNAIKEELNPPPGALYAEENEKGELVLLENGGPEDAESIPEDKLAELSK
jgi:hypothetical protein